MKIRGAFCLYHSPSIVGFLQQLHAGIVALPRLEVACVCLETFATDTMQTAAVQSTLAPHSALPASHCRSCNAIVTDNFCAKCGEPTHAHVPSAGEFVHEFVGHYVALEGKLWQTLKLLVLRPGELTKEFLAGRRMPYIPPLRLYLTLSLILFALIKVFHIELPQLLIEDGQFGFTYSHAAPGTYAPGKTPRAIFTLAVHDPQHAETADESPTVNDSIQDAIAAIGKVNTHWQDKLNNFLKQTDKEKSAALNHGFLAYAPYMLIGALPLFALYLKLIYRRSNFRYGEHLVFALHTNAFAFLVVSLMIVIPGSIGWAAMFPFLKGVSSDMLSAWDIFQIIPFLCLIAYLPMAMQRVYGGSRFATCCRWLVLVTAHVLVVGAATLIVEFIGIVNQA